MGNQIALRRAQQQEEQTAAVAQLQRRAEEVQRQNAIVIARHLKDKMTRELVRARIEIGVAERKLQEHTALAKKCLKEGDQANAVTNVNQILLYESSRVQFNNVIQLYNVSLQHMEMKTEHNKIQHMLGNMNAVMQTLGGVQGAGLDEQGVASVAQQFITSHEQAQEEARALNDAMQQAVATTTASAADGQSLSSQAVLGRLQAEVDLELEGAMPSPGTRVVGVQARSRPRAIPAVVLAERDGYSSGGRARRARRQTERRERDASELEDTDTESMAQMRLEDRLRNLSASGDRPEDNNRA